MVSPCVKLSSHPILEHFQSAILSTPYRLPSSFNGSLSIMPFQVTIWPTKQPKKTTCIATNRILPTSLSSSIQVINDTFWDTPPTHERIDSIYQRLRVSRDAKHINNRKDDVLLARLQSDHHPSLKQYLHRPDPSKDPICLNCRL